MRMMSFFLTTPQFRARTKSVTRRLGWRNAKVGDVVMAVVKGQGIPKGGHVEKLGPIRFTRVTWEQIGALLYGPPARCRSEVRREGFPDLSPEQFVEMFCKHNDCEISDAVTRIAYEYLDAEPTS